MLMGLMSLPAVRSQSEEVPSYRYFIDLLHSTSKSKTEASLDRIEQEWEESFELYAVETLYFLDESQAFSRLLLLLQDKTGEGFGVDFNAWYAYLWNKDPMYDEDYFSFKAALHAPIDRRFVSYFFGREEQSEIRLDEVRWGRCKTGRNTAFTKSHHDRNVESTLPEQLRRGIRNRSKWRSQGLSQAHPGMARTLYRSHWQHPCGGGLLHTLRNRDPLQDPT